MYFRKRKKGNAVLDVLIIFITIFIIGVFIVYFYSGIDPLQQELIIDFNESGDNFSRDFLQEQNTNYPTLWDAAIIFIFFGMWAAAILSGFLLDTYPAFFIIVVIIITPVLFAGITLSNIYEDLMTDDEIIQYQTEFPMSYWLITHFLPIGILLMCSIAGTIYAKTKI
ncbi:unnamed protein product [marine sediment metagenome]|uniref:Uncharacterized protein n=1 Tax=marine sediment metagenome TaxID=412755 RepID=X0ZER4_9ZZZZ